MPHVAIAFIWIISLSSILLMLIRPRGIAEAWWIGGGALLLVFTRLLPLAGAAHAIREGLDVYLFLIGYDAAGGNRPPRGRLRLGGRHRRPVTHAARLRVSSCLSTSPVLW